MFWFAIASLSPAVFLAAACLVGGPFPLLSVIWITVFVFFMDRWVARLMPDVTQTDGLTISYGQAFAHFALWGLGIWAVGSGAHLQTLDKAFIIIAIGLYFGQISNSNAHELIHNAARLPRRLGIAIYSSVLFGHHASAHTRVHHVYAATLQDPNTARRGEGFWRYVIRAWSGGWSAGLKAETKMRARKSTSPSFPSHPYVGYTLTALLACATAWLIAGTAGILTLLAISGYAQIQLYLSDYVQHYGLERRISDCGKPEPIGPQHSWNAPHWYSSAMMLNAPRHSDHHTSPARPFPTLRLDADTMPMLPHSLPVMAVIALWPPVWRRVMDPRVAHWRRKTAASELAAQ